MSTRPMGISMHVSRLQKCCQAAITDGGPACIHRHGVSERGANERQSENDLESVCLDVYPLRTSGVQGCIKALI